MKKWMFFSMMFVLMPLSMMAQDDDMYFASSKQKTAPVQRSSTRETVHNSGSSRSVDEYNRRSSYLELPADTGDIISFAPVEGVYPDSLGDFKYTRELSRWDGYTPEEAYNEGYAKGRKDNAIAWHSPWYHYYYPWYDSWYYDSWYYDPWYYGSWGWHMGWYDPWYSWNWRYGYPYYNRYGWYGWYGGYYDHYYGGYFGGGHRYNHYYGNGNTGTRSRGGDYARSGSRGSYSNSSVFNGARERAINGNNRSSSYGTSSRSTSRSTSYGSTSRSNTRTASNGGYSGVTRDINPNSSYSTGWGSSSSNSSGGSYSSGGGNSGGGRSVGGGGTRGGGGGGGSVRSGGGRR